MGGQEVRCRVVREGGERPALAVAAAEEPAPLVLPERLPLLRELEAERVVADEEAEEEARDPPRRVWRVVPPERRSNAPAWVVGQIVHGALEGWLFPDGGPSL